YRTQPHHSLTPLESLLHLRTSSLTLRIASYNVSLSRSLLRILMPKLPKPTDGELAILRVLWDLGPSTVRQIHTHLRTPTTYTTILKLLQIMTEKGLV